MQHPTSNRSYSALGVALAAGLLSSCASSTYQSGFPKDTSHVEVMYGQREFDSDFEPVEDQDAYGAVFTTHREGEFAGWEIGLIHSKEDGEVLGEDVELKATEIFAGGRYEFDVGHGPIHPYAGVGVSYLDAEVEVGSDSEDDSTLGFYAHVGAYANVGGDITVGIDYRIMIEGEVDFGAGDVDTDYDMLAFTVGFGF